MRQREAMAILEDRAKRVAVKRNPDPEARIEQMVHELAYERVKQSYLFNLSNEAVDRKADELAEQIAGLMEAWIFREVSAA